MNVINLNDYRSHTTPLASIIRVGDFNQQFNHYLASNILQGKRAVIDAYNVSKQEDLLNELRAQGFELILDTKAAELACHFKWRGQARKAEWLNRELEKPLDSNAFNIDLARNIAEFAVKNKFHVILSPSRYVAESSAINTLEQDYQFTIQLRKALDQLGGKEIRIASSFIGKLTLLGDETITSRLIGLHRSSPVDILWMRLSGLKRDPTAGQIRSAARRLKLLQETKQPIVLDYAGGLGPQTLMSLGAVSGLSFGALKNDQFSDQTWTKSPKSGDNSIGNDGRIQYARAPGLGRNLSHAELQLIAESPRGKNLLFDPSNTGITSFDEFKKRSRELALAEAIETITSLNDTPDSRRPYHIKTSRLDQNSRKALRLSKLTLDKDLAKKLKVKSPDSLQARLQKYATSLEKTSQIIDTMINENPSKISKPMALPHYGSLQENPNLGNTI